MAGIDSPRMLFMTTCIILTMTLDTGVLGYFCSRHSVEKCLQPFQRHAARIEGVYPEEEAIEHTCSAFMVMKKCVDPMASSCDVITRNMYEGTLEAYEYVCSKRGLAVYNKNRHCLGSASVQHDSHVCTKTYHGGAWQAQFSDTVKAMYKETCKQVDAYLDCIYDSVRKHCGRQAADWQHTVNMKALTPGLRSIDCKLDKDCGVNVRTVACVVTGALIVLTLLCLLIYKYLAFTKRRRAGPEPGQGHDNVVVVSDPIHRDSTHPTGVMYSTGHAVDTKVPIPTMAFATAPPSYDGFYDPPPYTAKEAEVVQDKPGIHVASDEKY